MTTYRPSAQVTLYLRVDEGNDEDALVAQLRGVPESGTGTPTAPEPTAEEPAQEPASTPETERRDRRIAQLNREITTQRHLLELYPDAAENINPRIAALRRQRDRLLAQRIAGPEPERPPVLAGQDPDGRFVRSGVIPVSVEINSNSFRTADTAKLVLNWRDVPFDPRLVRAAGVEIILGVVSPEDYEAGVGGERNENGQLRSVIRQRPAGEVAGSAIRFAGWVDTWNIGYDSDKGEIVMLECRDFTALFSDTPLASNSGIFLNVPIRDGVQNFIDTYNTLRGFPVRYGNPFDPDFYSEAQSPVPLDVLPSLREGTPTAPAAEGAPSRQRRQRRRARSGDQRMNVWDHITDICVQMSLIPIVKEYTLWLCPPRTLFSGQGTGRTGPDSVRRMVYGRNLTSLDFSRKLGGIKVPTIEVRAYDPRLGRQRWARWPTREGERSSGVFGVNEPPRALRPNEPGISGATVENRIQTFIVPPCSSGEALARIAGDLFAQIGRQEIEGNFETSDLASWDIRSDTPLNPDEADLLKLASGQSVELLVAPRDAQRPESTPGTLAELAALSVQGRTDYLVRLGWEREVAQRFAEWQEAYGFQTVFRVQNVRLSFDQDEGVKVKADFINYISVRDDVRAAAPTDATMTSPGAAALPDIDLSGNTIPIDPSPGVAALLGERDDPAAAQARGASSRRRFLERQRENGLATDEQVAAAGESERALVAQAVGQEIPITVGPG